MELEVNIERGGDVCVVTVSGEVDAYTAPRLKDALLGSDVSDCAHLVVDLNDVGFIDSSGLGVLVGALRRSKENGGTMRLACARDGVLKVLKITGLDKVFPIYADASQAGEF